MTTATAPTRVEQDDDEGSDLRWLVRDSWALTKRNLRTVRRQPQLLVFATVQPVIFILLFRYVFGGAISARAGSTTSTTCSAGSSSRRSPSPRSRPASG
jgi:hypothetical protein